MSNFFSQLQQNAGGAGIAGALGSLGLGFADIGTTIYQNQQNSRQADHMMDRAQESADRDIAFQRDMANTAHQREEADLLKAGLNPILAANKGAATPGGAQASGSPARMEDIGKSFQGTISSAMDALRLKKDIDVADSSVGLNTALKGKAIQDTLASGASAENTKAKTQALQATMDSIKAQAEYEAAKARTDKSYLKYDSVASRLHREAGTANNLVNSIPGVGNWMKQPEKWIDTHTGEVLNSPKY